MEAFNYELRELERIVVSYNYSKTIRAFGGAVSCGRHSLTSQPRPDCRCEIVSFNRPTILIALYFVAVLPFFLVVPSYFGFNVLIKCLFSRGKANICFKSNHLGVCLSWPLFHPAHYAFSAIHWIVWRSITEKGRHTLSRCRLLHVICTLHSHTLLTADIRTAFLSTDFHSLLGALAHCDCTCKLYSILQFGLLQFSRLSHLSTVHCAI